MTNESARRLNRDQVMEICRLSGREGVLYVRERERENLIFDAFVDF